MKKNLLMLTCIILTGFSWGSTPPNILLILADDLGYADLSVHGCTEFETPHIDSIFNNGVRFKQGYVSNSVCAPSRAGMITGIMGSRFGFEANLPSRAQDKGSIIGLDPAQKTMGDILKSAGYKTICLGKWHLGYNDELFHPNKRGFDEFIGLIGGSRSYFPIEFDPHHSMQYNGTYLPEEADFYVTDFLTEKAINLISQQQEDAPDQPFFMFLSYTAPHAPMHAKESDLARVSHIKNKNRQIYAGMMVNLDDNVGRILRHLEEQGIMDNTLLVFLSDNGGPLAGKNWSNNGQLRGKKGELYEGGIHVPYALQWNEKISGGQVLDNYVSSLDLLPTFVAASGAETQTQFDGVNLLPLVSTNSVELPERKFYWRRNCTDHLAIRDGNYKYFKDRITQKEYLFDVVADIGEKKNLAFSMPERLEAMRNSLTEWEGTIPDPAFNSGWRENQIKNNAKN